MRPPPQLDRASTAGIDDGGMKALVLSGGEGTRLRPLTHTTAKQLLPVANRPVLVRALEQIRDLGLRDVAIVVGDRAAQIEAVVGDGSRLGLKVTYLMQPAPLGLAHAVAIARAFLGEDDFLLYLGDNVFAEGLTGPAGSFRARRPAAHLVLAKVADPRRYGVAELDRAGGVRTLVEKPQQPASDLAVTGAYFFTARVHEAVAAIRPSQRGELEITDAICHLLATGAPVTAEQYPGYWQDTGTVEELLECNRMLMEGLATEVRGTVDATTRCEGPVVVGPGARVSQSHLVGPVIIGAHTTVHNSQLGPYVSVGQNCMVRDSGLQDSIALDGATIRGIPRIRHSLIGHRAELVRREGQGRAHHLVIGDHARAVLPT
jgi:glucose-1-phosphate thymidylyltransferase